MKFLLNLLKAHRTVGFIFLMLFSLQPVAQIVVNQTDMPIAGDTIRLSTSAILPGIIFQTAGAGVVWDFRMLQAAVQRVDTFRAVSSVPFIYQIIFNPTVATLAAPLPSLTSVPGIELKDNYQFFRKTSTLYALAGLGVTFNSIPLPMKFDNPDIWYRFPVTYLAKDSSVSTFSIGLPGFGLWETYRKRVNYIDAWGTVMTPYGSFPSIRVKSLLTTRDSIFIDSLSVGQAVTRRITEYKWLAKGQKVPVIQINEEGLIVTATYRDSLRVLVGLPEVSGSQNFIRIYPNPTSDFTTISFNQTQRSMVRIDIFDLNGRCISNLVNEMYSVGDHLFVLYPDRYKLQRGVYLLRFNSSHGTSTTKLLIK